MTASNLSPPGFFPKLLGSVDTLDLDDANFITTGITIPTTGWGILYVNLASGTQVTWTFIDFALITALPDGVTAEAFSDSDGNAFRLPLGQNRGLRVGASSANVLLLGSTNDGTADVKVYSL